jgi:hypothetical protein
VFRFGFLQVLSMISPVVLEDPQGCPRQLLISYSLCELNHFAAQPTVFAAKQRNLKPSFFHAAAAAGACARLIAAHLCWRRQRFT